MKKYLAFLLVLFLVPFTLAGCYNPATVMQIGGVEIPAGIYLNYQLDTAFQASAAAGDGYTVDKALLESEIEGTPAKEWIAEKTLGLLREYAFIETEFKSLGLSEYTLDSMMAIYETNLQSEWNNFASYYRSNGIGEETYMAAYRHSFARNMVYEALYAEEGAPNRPEEEEIERYFLEHYTFLDFIKLANTDAGGAALDDAGKAELKAAAESMREEAERAAAESGYFADGRNPGIEAAFERYCADAELAEADRESLRSSALTSDAVVADDATTYDAAFLAEVFAAGDDSYGVYQDSANTYLYCRRPVEGGADDLYTTYASAVISALKGGEFDEYVAEMGAALEVTEDARAVRHYRPENIKGYY